MFELDLICLTRSWLHQLKWYIGGQFTTQSATVDLDAQRVGDDDTHGIRWALALAEQSGGGQVDILVLQVTVQCNSYKNTKNFLFKKYLYSVQNYLHFF